MIEDVARAGGGELCDRVIAQATPIGCTPAAAAMAMSKLVSPIITVFSGSAPASVIASSSMEGCGLDGWRSAVWSVTNWSERP